MIIGSHVIVYSRDAEADRAFLRDVLKFSHVDAGGGWLIFGLPPSEMAFHPADGPQQNEFYLMCENIESFKEAMQARSIPSTQVKEERWGLLTEITLPGGGSLGVYEPRHARPSQAKPKAARRRAPKKKAAAPKKKSAARKKSAKSTVRRKRTKR